MNALELRLPPSLREFAGGAATVTVSGSTVGAALRAWAATNAALSRRLFAVDGHLRTSVALFLNDRQLDGPERADTPLKDGDRLELVATLAGG